LRREIDEQTESDDKGKEKAAAELGHNGGKARGAALE
jgi:hypothetical protein